jgi:acyl dehydratase
MYGERIVNSVFTLGVVVGIPVQETTLGTTLGNLGFEEIAFPAPVLIGDTLRVETEILSRRESKSRPDTGIVRFEHRGFNQNDKLVCRVQRSGLMLKKPAEVAVS